MSTIIAEIEAVLRKTEAVWDQQDYSALKDLWDTEGAAMPWGSFDDEAEAEE